MGKKKMTREDADVHKRHVDIVRVSVRTSKVLSKPVRVFVPVRIQSSGRIDPEDYKLARRVRTSPMMSESVLERARRDMLALIARYEAYAEFVQEYPEVIDAFRAAAQVIAGAGGTQGAP